MTDSTTPDSTADNLPQDVQLLLREYDHRFTEVMHHVARYEKQTDYLNVFLTSVVGVGGLVFSGKISANAGSSIRLAYIGVLVFLALLVFYLFSSIINSLFMVYLNGARIAAIENAVNAVTGKPILNWDSVAMPHFFKLKPVTSKLWVRPIVLSGMWILLIFLFVCVALSVLWFFFVQSWSTIYAATVMVLASFHIYQWILLNSEGHREIRQYFTADTSELAPFPVQLEHALLAVPIISVAVLVVASVRNGTFWLGSRVDFPLLSIPSVYVGDLFLLPWLNYRLGKWIRKHVGFTGAMKGWRIAAAVVMALLANAYIHYVWTHDPWSGFIDTRAGHLNIAGWDHFIFSTFEMGLILLFVFHWTASPYDQYKITAGKSVWHVYFAFASLALVDLSIKHLLILKTATGFWLLIEEAAISLVPLGLGALVFGIALRRNEKTKRKVAAAHQP